MIAALLLLLAQAPSVNQRVQQFYQFNVDKKWSEAAEMVAADTRDIYLSGTDRRLKGFRVDRIEPIGDGRAVAIVMVDRFSPDDSGTVLTEMVATTWKLENGEWRWYLQRSPW